MKGITVVLNGGERRTWPVPKGLNGHLCLRALHAANRGEGFAGLTERESAFVADIVAELVSARETAQ